MLPKPLLPTPLLFPPFHNSFPPPNFSAPPPPLRPRARRLASAGPQLLAEPVQRAAHLLLLQVERPHRLLLAAALGLCPAPNLPDDLEPERVPLQLALPTRSPPAAPPAVQRGNGRLAIQSDRPFLPQALNRLD